MQAHLEDVVRGFVQAVEEALGAGSALVLYGSAARGEHVDGFSDLNVLAITSALDPERLVRFGEALSRFEGRNLSPPLLLTEAEWHRAADAFPIEITDMQLAREVLTGADPVAGRAVDRPVLRQAIERDLRGKVLRLRQGYAVLSHDPAALGELGVGSVATVGVLLRTALALGGGDAPVQTPAALVAAGRLMGFDPAPATSYFAARGAEPPADRALFQRYLTAVETAVRFIDQFDVGGMR